MILESDEEKIHLPLYCIYKGRCIFYERKFFVSENILNYSKYSNSKKIRRQKKEFSKKHLRERGCY